jgi:hypothetical protein
MANKLREQVTLKGQEQANYLSQLDFFLSGLSTTLGMGIDETQLRAIKEFGDAEKWDWTRLPEEADTYLELGSLVEEVRGNYSWLGWQKNEKYSRMNRGYFDEIGVSTGSGLPWVFDIIQLHSLKEKAQQELTGMKSYLEGLRLLQELKGDEIELTDVPNEAERIYRGILKRSFLEQIQTKELIGWKSGGLKPTAKKIVPFGAENLWRINHARYMSNNMYELYVVDTWQDLSEPQITEKDGVVEVSRALEESLKFGATNSAWFVLKELDETFPSLHPVHISRGIVGPFENQYSEKNETQLPITNEILKENPDFALLRFKRQYSYAPNQVTQKNETRQVIYHQDWNDEILICQAGYQRRVAESVLGTNVRVVGI